MKKTVIEPTLKCQSNDAYKMNYSRARSRAK